MTNSLGASQWPSGAICHETARRRRGVRTCRWPSCTALPLGKLTFQIGDALLGVVLIHQQMVPPGSRGGRKSSAVTPDALVDELVKRLAADEADHMAGYDSVTLRSEISTTAADQ